MRTYRKQCISMVSNCLPIDEGGESAIVDLTSFVDENDDESGGLGDCDEDVVGERDGLDVALFDACLDDADLRAEDERFEFLKLPREDERLSSENRNQYVLITRPIPASSSLLSNFQYS